MPLIGIVVIAVKEEIADARHAGNRPRAAGNGLGSGAEIVGDAVGEVLADEIVEDLVAVVVRLAPDERRALRHGHLHVIADARCAEGGAVIPIRLVTRGARVGAFQIRSASQSPMRSVRIANGV